MPPRASTSPSSAPWSAANSIGYAVWNRLNRPGVSLTETGITRSGGMPGIYDRHNSFLYGLTTSPFGLPQRRLEDMRIFRIALRPSLDMFSRHVPVGQTALHMTSLPGMDAPRGPMPVRLGQDEADRAITSAISVAAEGGVSDLALATGHVTKHQPSSAGLDPVPGSSTLLAPVPFPAGIPAWPASRTALLRRATPLQQLPLAQSVPHAQHAVVWRDTIVPPPDGELPLLSSGMLLELGVAGDIVSRPLGRPSESRAAGLTGAGPSFGPFMPGSGNPDLPRGSSQAWRRLARSPVVPDVQGSRPAAAGILRLPSRAGVAVALPFLLRALERQVIRFRAPMIASTAGWMSAIADVRLPPAENPASSGQTDMLRVATPSPGSSPVELPRPEWLTAGNSHHQHTQSDTQRPAPANTSAVALAAESSGHGHPIISLPFAGMMAGTASVTSRANRGRIAGSLAITASSVAHSLQRSRVPQMPDDVPEEHPGRYLPDGITPTIFSRIGARWTAPMWRSLVPEVGTGRPASVSVHTRLTNVQALSQRAAAPGAVAFHQRDSDTRHGGSILLPATAHAGKARPLSDRSTQRDMAHVQTAGLRLNVPGTLQPSRIAVPSSPPVLYRVPLPATGAEAGYSRATPAWAERAAGFELLSGQSDEQSGLVVSPLGAKRIRPGLSARSIAQPVMLRKPPRFGEAAGFTRPMPMPLHSAMTRTLLAPARNAMAQATSARWPDGFLVRPRFEGGEVAFVHSPAWRAAVDSPSSRHSAIGSIHRLKQPITPGMVEMAANNGSASSVASAQELSLMRWAQGELPLAGRARRSGTTAHPLGAAPPAQNRPMAMPPVTSRQETPGLVSMGEAFPALLPFQEDTPNPGGPARRSSSGLPQDSEASIDDIVEQVWSALMLRLTVEHERRGFGRWS